MQNNTPEKEDWKSIALMLAQGVAFILVVIYEDVREKVKRLVRRQK